MSRKPESIEWWKDTPTKSSMLEERRSFIGVSDPRPVSSDLLKHWGATLDNFDPRVVDGIAAFKGGRRVLMDRHRAGDRQAGHLEKLLGNILVECGC